METLGKFQWERSVNGVQSLGLHGRQPSCFLVGSGVSVDPPSCLPTGLEFTRSVLSEMVPSSELPTILSMTASQDSAEHGRFIRFEHLMQLMSEDDPELRVLDALEHGEPNANHLTLAQLALAGHRLFTTNFDVLLERALMSLIPAALVRPIISEEDWQGPVTGPTCPVYKLHGSLMNTATGERTRDSIQATLRQIARNKEWGVGLEPFKRDVFAGNLRNSNLVVVGYSGFDDFDILPVLQKTESERRIVWVEHVTGIGLEDAEVLSLVRCPPAAEPTRVGRFLSSLAGSARRPENLFRVRVDTSKLLAELSGSRAEGEQPRTRPRPATKTSFNVREARKAFFAGEIYSFGYARKAMCMFRRSLELAQSDNDRMLESRSLVYIARQHEALLMSHGKTSDEIESHWRAAKTNLEAACRILETIPGAQSRTWMSTALNNLGMLYRHRGQEEDLERARDSFAGARAIDEEIGDQRGLSRSLNNLSAVEYAVGHLDAAIENCARACALDEALGDLHELTVHLSNLGKYRCDAGHTQAQELLRHSIELGKKLGLLDQVANTYNHVGRYYADHHRWREALESYNFAIEFAEGAGTALVDSFRRSAKSIQIGLELGVIRESDGVSAVEHQRQQREEPARLDPSSITGLIVLVPPGQSIANDQLTKFVIACYSQLNERLSARLKDKGLWTGLEIGYGVSPPGFPEGMIGLTYEQAKAEQNRGKTVLIQGPINISTVPAVHGYPSEVWILTVANTPAGREPSVGFVYQGPVTPVP